MSAWLLSSLWYYEIITYVKLAWSIFYDSIFYNKIKQIYVRIQWNK